MSVDTKAMRDAAERLEADSLAISAQLMRSAANELDRLRPEVARLKRVVDAAKCIHAELKCAHELHRMGIVSNAAWNRLDAALAPESVSAAARSLQNLTQAGRKATADVDHSRTLKGPEPEKCATCDGYRVVWSEARCKNVTCPDCGGTGRGK